MQAPKLKTSFSDQSKIDSNDQLLKKKFIPLLKWLSEAFASTVQYFFQYKYYCFKGALPFSKREIVRFTKKRLIETIEKHQEIIQKIINSEDIFKLLEHAFQFYKKPKMKTAQKINLETFYAVGYRSFPPPYDPFEEHLKEIKTF
jgi:hypothetical protein